MSLSFADFWKLAIASRVVSLDEAKQLHGAFARVKGAAKGNGGTLAEWLITQAVLTRYQADFLLSGSPGPFIFGDYKVYDRVASGRLADLFKAIHLASGHPVLLSFLSGEATQDPNQWRSIARQAQATIAAANAQLARVFELVDADGYKFVVLEDLMGESVEQRWAGQRAPMADAVRIAQQAALALARLHAQGVAHGDVRPANLWQEAAGGIKLLGFPLQRDPLGPDALNLADTDPHGRMLAAIDYLAPELGQPGRPPDALADIYALGCTLFRLLAGNAPFAAGDVRTKLHRHATEPIAPLDRAAGVPPQLVQVVAYMMAKNPHVRYQQAAQVAEALTPFAASAATVAPQPNARTLQAFQQALGQSRGKQSATPASTQQANTQPATKPAAAANGNGTQQRPGAGRPQTYTTSSHSSAAAPVVGAANMSKVSPPAAGKVAAGAAATKPATSGGPATSTQSGGQATLAAGAAEIPEFGDFHLRPAGSPGFAQAGAAVGALPTARQAKKKSNSNLIVVGTVAALAMVIGGILVVANSGNQPGDQATKEQPAAPPATTQAGAADPPPEQVAATNVAATPSVPGDEPAGPNEPKPKKTRPKRPKPDGEEAASGEANQPEKPKFAEIPDDGRAMWISPTSGDAISLQYVPPGAQVFITARPADLLASEEGQKLPVALGPAYDWIVAQIKSITGLNLDQIEYLLVAFSPTDASEPPQASLVVQLKQEMPTETLLELWKNPAATGEGDKKFYSAGAWAYYIPAAGKQRVFAVASPAAMAEVVTMDGPPSLRPAMDKMLRDTDAARSVNLLFSPALFTDTQLLFAGNLERLREPLRNFLGDDVQAALVSLNFGQDFFAELRVHGSLDKQPVKRAETYKDQVGELQKQIRNFMGQITPQPYGKAILVGFEGMIRQTTDLIRVGEENGNSLVRCYLPGPAGHNLVMATELALCERPGAVVAVAANTVKPKAPLTVADVLKQKITLSFPRDTLEKCMEYLGKEIGTEIVILGADLQLDGITKNQSFGLDERDQPAGEILRKIMKLANPDGKLIYVIKPKNEGEKDIIFITTRAAAEKRGDKVPAELAKEEPKKK